MEAPASDLRDQLQQALGTAYTIERELGGGGMARVFVAAERRFDRRVVVKVLVPDLAAGVSADRFEREVKLAAQMQQANIVPVFSAGEAAGLPFYTMPWVEGESLRARLTAGGALPLGEATAIISDVSKALAYAHTRGIVHRDIKPENILLSGGTAVVTDFGIAKAIRAARGDADRPERDSARDPSTGALTSVGTSLGTPAYMAPEQAMGDPATDHRADLYALGVTAYEMLVGERPFTATSPHALVRAHVTETPKPVEERRPNLPPALAAIVMRCLAKDPADRPQSAEAVLRAIERVDAPDLAISRPAMAGPTGRVGEAVATPQPSAAARRGRLISIGVGVLAVGAIAAAVVLRGRAATATPTVVLDPATVLIATPNAGGDTSLRSFASIVADGVTRGFAQIPAARIVEDTAAPVGDNRSTWDAGAAAHAHAAGAGTVVSTWLAAKGSDSARIQFHVIDASTGRVIRVLSPVVVGRAADDAEWTRSLDQLLATVGIVTTSTLGPAALPLVPPQFAAVREMLVAFSIGGSADSASRAAFIEHTRRAAGIDTSYAQARLWHVAVRENFFLRAYVEGTRQAVDSLRTDFGERRDRFTPFENALYDYVLAFDRGDPAGVLRAQRRMVELAPSSFFVVQLPNTLLDLNRPREALALLQQMAPFFNANHKLASAADDPRRWTTIADIQHYLHDYRAELEAAERSRALDPGNISRLRAVLRANAGLGDSAAIERVLAAASNMQGRPNTYDFYGDLVMQSGQEIRAHGHPEFGKALGRRAISWFESRPAEDLSWRMRFRWALAHHDLGEEARAAEILQPLLDTKVNLTLNLGLAGRLAAGRGDSVSALRISKQLADMGSRLQGANTLERAFIASMLGKRDEAVALLQQSFAEGQGFFIRWRLHWFSDVRPLVGYPPFERLLEPQG